MEMLNERAEIITTAISPARAIDGRTIIYRNYFSFAKITGF